MSLVKEFYMRKKEELSKRIEFLQDKIRCCPIDWVESWYCADVFGARNDGEREEVVAQLNWENSIIYNYMVDKGVEYDKAVKRLVQTGKIFGQKSIKIEIPYFTGGTYAHPALDQIKPLCRLISEKASKTFTKAKVKPCEIRINMNFRDVEQLFIPGVGFVRGRLSAINDLWEIVSADFKYPLYACRSVGNDGPDSVHITYKYLTSDKGIQKL